MEASHDNIIASGLIKYFNSDQTDVPQINISNWQSLSDKYLDKVSDWVQGNTKAANMIMFNCALGSQSVIANYNSAADMWNALEQTYEGTGIVVQHQQLINFVSMKYDDYDDLSSFIIAFKNTIQRLSQVMDNDDKIPPYWPAMLFVNALHDKFPIWADRQRNRQRDKITINRPSLENLIADIHDEARRTNTILRSDTAKALLINGEDKYRNSAKRCDTCNSRHHVTKDCLHNNPEKRKAWEDKTGKK
ncbi:Gag-Pol polyprotein [Golovinomyces cichoracearum]|uniref:Gag-Pol polyprotein n=1 Tax=Golovinomyces cichoracearum TaxID=62708 RepID=A0A420J8Q1_9PEZI|nr:Gag-Pol polyprotein [Golovinomyces cichoracearum]